MNFNLQTISQSVTRSVGKSILKSKKNSPHIFFVGGVVGVIGSGILACRATLKLEETLDDIRSDVDAVKRIKSGDLGDSKKETYQYAAYVTLKSTASIGRLYLPSIVLGGISIAALTGSHVQLTRRNAALSTTLAVVTKAYEEYRVRVQKEIGKDRELEVYHGIEEKEIDVNGKKKIIKTATKNSLSPYARFFDDFSSAWQKNAEMNRIFLECQQNYFNHILTVRGHVFLNEVYDAIGLERSQAGQVVGWVIHGEGDNYIDFGLYDAHNAAFINGLERVALLDFNVDGVVYDKI